MDKTGYTDELRAPCYEPYTRREEWVSLKPRLSGAQTRTTGGIPDWRLAPAVAFFNKEKQLFVLLSSITYLFAFLFATAIAPFMIMVSTPDKNPSVVRRCTYYAVILICIATSVALFGLATMTLTLHDHIFLEFLA